MANIDRPVPGQSLTRAPGSRPYEHPPKFTDIEEASNAVLKGLSTPKAMAAVSLALDKGVAASHIATHILKGGIATGQWTPDVAVLIGKRTLGAVAAVGVAAGSDPKKIRYVPEKRNELEDLMAMDPFGSDYTQGPTEDELKIEQARPGFDEVIDEAHEPLPKEDPSLLDTDVTRPPERTNPEPISLDMGEDITYSPFSPRNNRK